MKRAARTIVGVLFAANAAVAVYACTGDNPIFAPASNDAGVSDGGEAGAASDDGSVADVRDGSAGDSDSGEGAVARLFVFGGFAGDGDGGDIFVADVRVAPVFADGGLGAWQLAAQPLPEARRYSTAVSAGPGYVVLVGGETTGGVFRGDVIGAAVDPGGLGGWTTQANALQVPRNRHAVTVQNGRAYVFGGVAGNGATLDDVSSAVLSPTSVGGWTSTQLPFPRSRMSAASTPGSIYLVGGAAADGGELAEITRAVIEVDGGISYQPQANGLPTPRQHTRSVVHGGSLIVTGGELVGAVINQVVVYSIDAGQLGPAQTTAMPRPVYQHAMVQYANRLYVIGGNSIGRVANVTVGDIGATGAVTGWRETTPLPIPLAYHAAAVF